MPRRRNRWTYVVDPMNGPRWRLEGTALDLRYDDLDGGGALRGAWCLWLNGQQVHSVGGIDHYLDGSMRYVEEAVEKPGAHGGDQRWAAAGRAQLSNA